MSAGFSFASPDDRTLSLGAYLLGSLELGVIVGALAFAAWRVRAAVLGGWSGAPARLVEAILAIAALTLLAELLGTFSAFGSAGMIAGSLLLAALAWWAGPRLASSRIASHARTAAPEAPAVASWIAAAAVAAVVAAWMVPTLSALAGGLDRADSLWYHMPLAARFAESGDLGRIDYFDPIFFASYYPANSEIPHALGILAYDRDILSPLINLGWLALGLLAAYCVGRPYGLGPVSLLGGATAMGAQMLIEFQAGEALNDIGGVALVLAAVAVLVNGWVAAFHNVVLVVAGLAAGMAAGTKLSFLAPVAALAVGVAVVAGRAAWWRAFGAFSVAAFVGGGYWYVRNAVAVGNPIPFTGFGPLGLPAPERSFELRPGHSVFHYATDFDVWADWFFPGLSESFGFLWPLFILGFVGAGAAALAQRADPLLRALGAVVLFTAVAYVFTPLTAAGEEGQPIAFEWNVRYMAPAAAVGLALLPCVASLRASAARRSAVLAGLAVLFVSTIASLVQWQQGHLKGALASGVAVLAAFAVWRVARERGWLTGLTRARMALVAGVSVLAVLAAGWWEQGHYLERRYENLSPQLKLADAVRWARELRDAKVAVSGVRGVFNQYPFYGTDLSNEVQWLGVEGPDGAYLRIPTCSEWRAELAAGGYTHVVTTYDPFNPGALTDTKEGLWTRRDPAAEEVLRDGPVSVFELTGEPDPSTCGDLPDLTPAELNGDSVNEEPLANQPRIR